MLSNNLLNVISIPSNLLETKQSSTLLIQKTKLSKSYVILF